MPAQRVVAEVPTGLAFPAPGELVPAARGGRRLVHSSLPASCQQHADARAPTAHRGWTTSTGTGAGTASTTRAAACTSILPISVVWIRGLDGLQMTTDDQCRRGWERASTGHGCHHWHGCSIRQPGTQRRPHPRRSTRSGRRHRAVPAWSSGRRRRPTAEPAAGGARGVFCPAVASRCGCDDLTLPRRRIAKTNMRDHTAPHLLRASGGAGEAGNRRGGKRCGEGKGGEARVNRSARRSTRASYLGGDRVPRGQDRSESPVHRRTLI